MLKKRIIPCLDIKEGRTVKGVNFENIRDAGDPVFLAKMYADQGADEIVFLDITATQEKRKTLLSLVEKIAAAINIPFTVGGGIQSVEIAGELIAAGADKISLNSAAVKNPDLIQVIAGRYGTQAVVVAIDVNFLDGNYCVYINGGKMATTLSLQDWVLQCEQQGAGEILLTSMNNDGTKEGFDLDSIKCISDITNLPIIASGGAGSMTHFTDVFKHTEANAALAASIFHFGEIAIPDLKKYLKSEGLPIRI